MQKPAGRVTAVTAAGALAVLLATAPTPAGGLATLRDLGASTDATAPVVAVAALVAWGLAGWLALLVAGTLLSRLPGRVGRAAARTVRRLAPAVVRRAVEVALGVTVTATALGAGPAVASDTAPPSAPAATAPSLDWPGTPSVPDLDWPGTPAATTTPTSTSTRTERPAPPAPVRAAQVPGEPTEAVVVQPGDSLWALAERDLAARTGTAPTDAQTAAAWPSWWAANRDAVGADPHLVHPGTALTPPQHLPPAASPPGDA